jgi:two-component system cell cycle sensor histidine kinase PleC
VIAGAALLGFLILTLTPSPASATAGALPLLALVCLGWFIGTPRHIIVLAAIFSGLVAVESVTAPGPWATPPALIDLGLALYVIWVVAGSLVVAKRRGSRRDASGSRSAERAQFERTIEDRETRFRNLIEGSIQGVLIHRDGKPLFANQAMADLFGYESPEEILALESIRALKAEHERDRLESFSAARLRNRRAPMRYEFEGLRKDGRAIWLENFVTVIDWNGEPAVQSTTVGITKRKRAEEAVKHSERVLQARVADLEQAQSDLERQGDELVRVADELKIANARVRAASNAKSDFLAAMSHELRTPLTAIIGFSEIIKDETFGPVGSVKYRSYATDIHKSGQYLLDLINDILDLSKIESGTEELHEEDIEVSDIARSAFTLVRQRAQEGDIEIVLDIPDGLPPLRADPRKLRQVLVNLLANAVKFTDAGGRVALKAWCRPDSGFVIQVVDDGIGIAPEDIPKALSQFGQVGESLDELRKGTGLGLPLSKSLIELHGGSLDLQSVPGAGSTVTLRFPAVRIVGSPCAAAVLNGGMTG